MNRKMVVALVVLLTIGLIGGLVVYGLVTYRSVRVPTGAMMNTILIGDRVLVASSVGEIRRGDVVVFRYPKDPQTMYLKRVVGLPGETIEIESTKVIVDGNEIPERRVYAADDMDYSPMREFKAEGSGPYTVYYSDVRLQDAQGSSPEFDWAGMYAVRAPYRIPGDSYFMMGDNRDNSEDSRVWGPVKRDLIVGKAVGIYSSPECEKSDPASAPSLWSLRRLD